MRRLLPRMPLAGYAAAVLHPLLRCLDGGLEELCRDAADTICALALALGPDFALFVPTIRKARPLTLRLSRVLTQRHPIVQPQRHDQMSLDPGLFSGQ